MTIAIDHNFQKQVIKDYVKILWLGTGFSKSYEDVTVSAKALNMPLLHSISKEKYNYLAVNIKELSKALN